MLDNNLSPLSSTTIQNREFSFQSFLCWIIIYHLPGFLVFYFWDSSVSILLMLDNNLSPWTVLGYQEGYNAFQSFLCWIIIYHLCIYDYNTFRIILFQSFLCWIIIYHQDILFFSSLAITLFQSFLCWIIIYHQVEGVLEIDGKKRFNPSYAG